MADLQLRYTLAQPQAAHLALSCTVLPHTAVPYAAMQALAMQFTAMLSVVSSSVMMARPNQLGFISVPLNIQGTQFTGLIYA